jgi:hypothetical protein
MEMMNKTIDNDLKAQQETAENKQNFLKIAQQNPLVQSEIKKMNADTAATTQAVAMNHTYQATFDSLAKKVQAMPEGPQKQAAQQALAAFWQNGAQKLVNAHSAAAALTPMMSGSTSEQPNQPSQDSLNGVKTILKPGASLQGLQYMPQMKETLPEAKEQFTQAQVADKFLTALPDIFKEARDSITGLGSTQSQIEKGLSGFGAVGKGLSSVTGIASDWESRTRRVGQLKDNLKTELANVLAHTNIHGDEINNIVDRNFPDGRDSDKDIDKKVAGVAGMIKRLIPQSAIDQAKLTNK